MGYTPQFHFPLRELESERVKLALFDVGPFLHDSELDSLQSTDIYVDFLETDLHAEDFVENTKGHPELFKYLPYGSFDSVDKFVEHFYRRIVSDPACILFAIFDTTANTGPRLAGIVGLLNSDVVNQSTEIGFITTLPEFQRTHVTSNAVGLLLHYCLELPSGVASPDSSTPQNQKYGPGLGLRRVQWQCHAENEASARTAERMGFRREGSIRWQRILPLGEEGARVSEEREALCKNPGRHTCMLSLCWDDWEFDEKREHVQKQMART